MKVRDALSAALVMVIEETHPVINVRSVSHQTDSDDWVIETKDSAGNYSTIRELPKEKP
jgi:hypothetical protein